MISSITYSQLDRLFGALGFEVASSGHPGQVYRHPESGVIIVLAMRRPTDLVSSADLMSARRHLIERGLLDDDIFWEFASTGAIPANR